MTAVVITGTGLVGPDPGGPVAVDTGEGRPRVPQGRAFRATSFDPVAELGRKAARFNHRSTLLAIAACGAALRDAGIEVGPDNQEGIGVTLGTFCGSVSGSVDFAWESYAQPRPYMVNPAAFPNLVINTAAGAVAIHHGLRGANSTVAGGPLAGVLALRHAALTLRAGHVDTVLTGASEEYGTHEAWLAAATRPELVPGEAAGVLVVESEAAARSGGRRELATVAAVLSSTVDTADAGEVRGVLAEALERAGVESARVRRIALRTTGAADVDAAARAAAALVPVEPVHDEPRIGDCHAAHAAVQLVDTVEAARHQGWAADEAGVVLALDPDGSAAVAVLTGPRTA
ncbi:MAG TPA: beta-ketoacyl synthase N-terminal-like domain-containing protein [Streptomyces sp.]